VTNILYPRNPSRILTTAYKMGIAITLALARDRATGEARPLYFGQGNRIKGMARVWSDAKEGYQQTVERGSPNATPLLKAENNIRRSFTRILLKTSVRYGNTETKRVKREEGNKMYLNIIWDYTGGRLRDVTKGRYFFPKPVSVETDDGKKVDGYYGSSKMPFYPVRHNHLPELDFADMIRSPLMELGRQCLKYGTPLKDAKKYVDMLLFRLLPFLDYVYSERRSGRGNYVRDGLRELRTIVELIKNEYGSRNGRRQSITAEVMESIIDDAPIEIEEAEEYQDKSMDDNKKHILQDVINDAKREGAVLDVPLQTLEELLKNGILDKDDSEELLKEYQEQSRKLGVKIHRFVSNNFQKPFSFKGIIYYGTEMAYDNSGLILLSETPIDDGRGRLDFILARAKAMTRVDDAPSIITCEPFMIVDLKTKSAFDFDIYGVESRSKDEKNVVREFVLSHREMNDEEWSDVLSTTPDDYETEQLEVYEKATLADYKRFMQRDVDAPKNLVKAVLVIDSCQSWREISEAILPLVMEAYQGCVDGTLSERTLLVPSKKQRKLRVALRMLSVMQPTTKTEELDIPVPQKPFKQRVEDHKELQLYLTIPGSGSPSQSAASVAERWHGLEYIHSLVERRHRDVYWLDMGGEYTDPVLRKKQFRLKYQTKQIQRFFRDRVQMIDLSKLVRTFVYKGTSTGSIKTWIQNRFKNSRKPLVVVSGWEHLRRSTPKSYQKYLDEIVTITVQSIPVKSTIVWFARPVPISQSSISYSTRCVAPFYQGSVWQNLVDTIIWNVPMPPDRSGARISTNYHERGILIERPERPPELKIIEIDPLRGWGQDFQPGGRKFPEVYYRSAGGTVQQSRGYSEKQLEHAKELIPHLLPHQDYNPVPRSDFDLDIEEASLGYKKSENTMPRLTFNPIQVQKEIEKDDRVKLLLPMISINRKRESRQIQLNVSYQQRTTRPPSEYYLADYDLRYRQIALDEIRNLKDTIKFLKQVADTNLIHLLNQIEKTIENLHPENVTSLMNTLRLGRQILETNTLSKQIWEQLLPYRSVMRNLSKAQKDYVTNVQMNHPDILFLIGNHLFLLILAAHIQIQEVPFTQTLTVLWDYLRPWQLIGLGMKARYPKNHITGKSILDRHRLLEKLRKKLIQKNKTYSLQTSLTRIRYGLMIVLPSTGDAYSTYLWLLFQRNPSIVDMNAALLQPRGMNPSLSPVEILKETVSGRTFWSESDLNLLSKYARLQGDEDRTRIMIAEQHGEQILWVDDKEKRRWIPVGRLHYTTRRFEDVTLIRTFELSEIHYLQPVEYENVRQPLQQVEDMVLRAMFILNKGLEGCVATTCEVQLDANEKMYRVIFTDVETKRQIGELLINRTVDLLEILRRPDIDCEPVMINDKRLIWNRFNDISYLEDVAILRPWVTRYDPFPGMNLSLPPTALDLLNTSKEYDVTLELYHDSWTCPLKHVALEDIKKQHGLAKAIPNHYLFRSASSYGEPFHISNEPGMKHGSCWRIGVDTPFKISSNLQEIVETMFTDTQVRSLLESHEIVYWSEEKQAWVTHTFSLVIKQDCIEETKESWHLRTMIAKLSGRRYDSNLPGVYLQNPDRWSPYINIEPEYVSIGLREKATRQTREKQINKRNIALQDGVETRELLENELTDFVKELGIMVSRILMSEISGAIDDAFEIYGIDEGKAKVEFEYTTIDQDSVGGRLLYVVLVSELETHKVPVTRHLHDIQRLGKLNREDFENRVRGILGGYNLSKRDVERAVKECYRVLKRERLISR